MIGYFRLIVRLSWLVITGFLVLIPLLILAKLFGLPMRIRHGLFASWRVQFLWVLGIRVNRVEGQKPAQSAILMGNHRSYADVLFIESGSPTIFLGKDEVRTWPFIGWAAMAIDTVFVKRKNKASRSKARQALADRIKMGLSPVVFPEGTTVAQGLLPFHPGMFYTAAELSLPVIPFVLNYSDPEMAWVGEEKFVPHLLRVLQRPRWSVDLHIGPTFSRSDAELLHQEVRAWMESRVK